MSPSTVFAASRREFSREIKFLVTAAQAEEIRHWSRNYLVPDPHCVETTGDRYPISSLYYDTADFAIFRRQGWIRYSKFRIRRYAGGTVFLERKLKVAGHVAKRRAPVTMLELAQVAALPTAARWFVEKTMARGLRPVCQLDYERTARVLLTSNGPIRLTLDDNVCARPIEDAFFVDDIQPIRLTTEVVVEMKFRREMPLLFRELAALFNLTPRPFSKYHSAVETLQLCPLASRSESGAIAPCPSS